MAASSARRRAARACVSGSLIACIVFLVWLAAGPSDDDDGGQSAASSGSRPSVVEDDLRIAPPEDLLSAAGGVRPWIHGPTDDGGHIGHIHRHHHHHHHHGGGALGRVRTFAEDALDDAQETFRHFFAHDGQQHEHDGATRHHHRESRPVDEARSEDHDRVDGAMLEPGSKQARATEVQEMRELREKVERQEEEIAATSAEKIAEKAKADEKIAQLEARVAELKRSALYAEGRVDGDGGTFHLKPHVVGAEDTHVVATEPSNDVSEQATSVWRRPSVEKTSASDSKEKLEEPANVFLPTEAQKWKPVEVFPRSPGTINHTDIRRYTAPVKDWGKGGDGDGIEDALEGLDPKTTPLVVTFANKDYAQFLVNWIVHARMSGIERSAAIVIGAMDERVLKVARRWNLRAFSMEHTIHSFGWGAQIGVINDLITEFKFSVLMCDVDMVWLKDPFPWINAVPARANADVLLSSDCASCMQDEADGKCIFAPFNIGIMYWRATEMASELGKTWADQVKKGGRMDYMEEQNVLNDVIRGENWVRLMPAAPVPGTVAKQRAFVVYSRQKFGNVSVGQMPVANFAHGHTYFTTKQPQRLSVDVYAVHATFQFGPKRQGQFMGKRQRFREEGLWVLDPVKHYEEGKFLTWSEELPLQFRDEDSPEKGDLNFHLRVVKHHLKAMRNGMLLAKKLGRILIIPRLTCFCDRHWTPILPECAMKDSDLVPPFHCPLDHLFNPVTFWRGAAQLGVDIREIGFLDDVRVPDRVKQDVARVKVGSFYVPAPDARGNIVHPNAAPPPDAEILPDSNDDEIAERLRPLEDRTVIMISDMAGALCGLKSSEENDHAEHVMYNGDRKNRNPLRGGILNGFDWCCWNPLKTEKPPGYQPTAMPYRMPEPLDSQRCSSEPRLVAANTFSEKERNLTSV